MTLRATRAFASIGVAISLLLLPVLAGCGDNQDDAGARRLLARVRADGYRNWERAPGWPSRRATSAPHGETVDIYVNDVITEALVVAEPLTRWPEDSIIVKDGWDDSDLEIIAIMEKRSDGWYWAEFDDDGDPDYSGHPDVCIDCHRDGSDYVRSFRLP
jgi:hypothetical protein